MIKILINTYKNYQSLINILLLMILVFPFFAHIYLYILKDKLVYFYVFIFCGILLGITSQVYSKEIFIKKVTTYIFSLLVLVFIITFLLIILAFGGKQGAFLLNLLDVFPGKYLFYSIATKFTAISLIIYSAWLLIYIFLPKDFFERKSEKLIKYEKILWGGYLLLLFYPAIHYLIFSSKDLLKQFIA